MFHELKHRMRLLIGTLATSLLAATVLSAADTSIGQVQRELERMAQTYSHFARTTIVYNRQLRLWEKKPLVARQDRLVRELRALSGNRESLAALIEHPNPKVRTLALGALFAREDGRDLPLIASLVDDDAPTFPDLHESRSSALTESMSDLESPQTVDHVAQAMLKHWGVPTGRGKNVTAETFKKYWKKYEGRQRSASWFVVKMKRATRQTTPIQAEYRPDIQRVLTEMDALPPVERAWTRLFVLCSESWDDWPQTDDALVSEKDRVAAARELGPEALLRFLQRKPVTDDPDLWMKDKENRNFVGIANFILRHADQLLRPEDADALLACENAERDNHGVNPSWSIGAAALQPARASEILRTALKRETRSYVGAAGLLAGGLWRIRGSAELSFLTDWFYAALVTARDPHHQPEIFLQKVRLAGHPDTKELLVALMKHPRFELTDWHSLKAMLEIANTGRATPLMSLSAIYDGERIPDQKTVLAGWRNLLRHEYGLTERRLPIVAPQPKHVLTQPIYATPLAASPSQIMLSPDGQLLATLIERRVEIWEAKSGKALWQIPSDPGSWYLCLAFQDAGQRLMLVGQWRLSEWNVAARKLIAQTKTTSEPSIGVSQGPNALERAALRAGYAGNKYFARFDPKRGRALWQHKDVDGIGSVVALSHDGNLLAAGGGSDSIKTIKLFEALTGKLLRQFDEHAGRVAGLAFSPDGGALATATAADGPRLWDVATGKLRREYPYTGTGDTGTLVFSPDGHWLAVVGASDTKEGRIGIFCVSTGQLQWEICHNRQNTVGPWGAMTFAADGRVLYTGAKRLEAWSLK